MCPLTWKTYNKYFYCYQDSPVSQKNLQAVTTKSKSFPVMLGTLEQHLATYSHLFEEEFRPYVTPEPLPLNGKWMTSGLPFNDNVFL